MQKAFGIRRYGLLISPLTEDRRKGRLLHKERPASPKNSDKESPPSLDPPPCPPSPPLLSPLPRTLPSLQTALLSAKTLSNSEREAWFPYKAGTSKYGRPTYLPTKFSSTEDLPADCPPTTAIWGKSSCICTPNCVKASWSLFTMGMSCSIPTFPDILVV